MKDFMESLYLESEVDVSGLQEKINIASLVSRRASDLHAESLEILKDFTSNLYSGWDLDYFIDAHLEHPGITTQLVRRIIRRKRLHERAELELQLLLKEDSLFDAKVSQSNKVRLGYLESSLQYVKSNLEKHKHDYPEVNLGRLGEFS